MDQAPSTKPALAPAFDPAAVLRLTAVQFEKMYYAGVFTYENGRVELREGLLCRMNAQHIPQVIAKTDVYDALRDALRDLGSFLRVVSEGSVRVGDYDVPEPDIIVWDPIRARGAIPVERVRLVAEICDTTQDEDVGRKPALYATAAIPECWIVDLPDKIIHQRRAPSDGAYTRETTIPFGGTIASTAVPGLAIGTAMLQEQDTPEQQRRGMCARSSCK